MTAPKDQPPKITKARKGRVSGPPPVPNEVHRRRGNPSKKPLPDEATVHILPGWDGKGDPPPPPVELGPRGMDLWARAWVDGHLWLSKTSDVDALATLCEHLDEREDLRAHVMSSPEDWRMRSALRALDKQVMDGLQLLGFTPSDRARMGVAEVKAENPLEAFRKSQDA